WNRRSFQICMSPFRLPQFACLWKRDDDRSRHPERSAPLRDFSSLQPRGQGAQSRDPLFPAWVLMLLLSNIPRLAPDGESQVYQQLFRPVVIRTFRQCRPLEGYTRTLKSLLRLGLYLIE